MKMKYRKFLYWGVTALLVIVLAVVFFFCISKFNKLQEGVQTLASILAPVIYGAVMAYLMTPVYNRVAAWIDRCAVKVVKERGRRRQLASLAATVVSLIVLCTAVIGLLALLLPQLFESILGITESLPRNVANLQYWLEQTLSDNPGLEEQVLLYYRKASSYLQEWLQKDVVPNIYNILGGVSSGVINVIVLLKNILIGLIVMIYLLNLKEKLVTQIKMVIYGIFPLKIANKILEESRRIHSVFGGFFIGKIVDSFIIGVLCFILLSIMNMPYVLLVSVVIGCTNVIPFFGPFIGAIPTSILILLVSPMKCLYFVVFIFLLQTFDGYILGPKILGGSTGLSSFWVLFSILLFGGLFGFVGMIIGVPTFAVLYSLVEEAVVYRLEKNALSGDIRDYEELDHIDSENNAYVKR